MKRRAVLDEMILVEWSFFHSPDWTLFFNVTNSSFSFNIIEIESRIIDDYETFVPDDELVVDKVYVHVGNVFRCSFMYFLLVFFEGQS